MMPAMVELGFATVSKDDGSRTEWGNTVRAPLERP